MQESAHILGQTYPGLILRASGLTCLKLETAWSPHISRNPTLFLEGLRAELYVVLHSGRTFKCRKNSGEISTCLRLAPSPASAAFRSQNTCWGLQVRFNKRRGPEAPAFAHLEVNKTRMKLLPKPDTWADEIVNGATSLRNSSGALSVHGIAWQLSTQTTDELSCNAMPAQVAFPQMVTLSSCASSTNLQPGSLHYSTVGV